MISVEYFPGLVLKLVSQYQHENDEEASRLSGANNEGGDDTSTGIPDQSHQERDTPPTSNLDGDKEPDFEFLFKKFQDMKTEADQLTGDERKSHAEKVTIAFWKALGGDQSEIEGLDDS
ncbi:uncharacterized protein LOC141851093 [Brevipalpus obovatus]|uniref:uncharacterized protein LOC141851093 n=1 Tax=Brevipalpus obovatus TaxID=246614 RepID=UPI003D9F0126